MAFVTLIRPSMIVPRWAASSPICPPLGLAYIAAVLRQAGHELSVIDSVADGLFRFDSFRPNVVRQGLTDAEILGRVPKETDAIGITLHSSQEFPPARALVREARRRFPNAFLFAGGEHPTAQPMETLAMCPELDAVAMGEGEETVVDLLGHLSGRDLHDVKGIAFRDRTGNIMTAPRRPRVQNVDDIPEPAWDLFNLTPYLDNELGIGVKRGRSMPMLASRGCPYECTFCSSPSMWGTQWVARDPEKVLQEMIGHIERYGAENFDFYDLTAIVRRKWIVEFTQQVIESGYRFTWQLPIGTRSEVLDEEVLGLLYASGCRNICYAPESGSPALLRRVKKGVNLSSIQRSMRAAVKRGLNVHVHMVSDLPSETIWDRARTLAFLAKLAWIGVDDVNMLSFSAYPGSALFDELKKEGRISFSDDYYFSIDCQGIFGPSARVGTLGPKVLAVYRLSGMALFFLLSFLLRPWRVMRVLKNLLFRRQESRLEKSLVDVSRRFRKSRGNALRGEGVRPASPVRNF